MVGSLKTEIGSNRKGRFRSGLIIRMLISNILVIFIVLGIGILLSFQITKKSLKQEGERRVEALKEIHAQQINDAKRTLLNKIKPQMNLLISFARGPLVTRVNESANEEIATDSDIVGNFNFCNQMKDETAIAHCLRWRSNELVSRTIKESHKGFLRSAIHSFLADEDIKGILILDWDHLYYEGQYKKDKQTILPLHSPDEFKTPCPSLEQDIFYDDSFMGKVIFFYTLERINRIRQAQKTFITYEKKEIEKTLEHQAHQFLSNRIFEGIFFLIILISAVSLVILTTVISPIRKLTQDADALSKGKLDLKIDTSRNDEIGSLSKSFESMRHSIRHKLSLLNESRQIAEAANEAKDRFLTNISHEIRTPLNGVIANTDLALYENLSPKLTGHLESIRASAYTLLGMINDIIDFSSLNVGDLKLKPIFFNPENILIRVADIFAPKAEEKQIELLIDWRVRSKMQLRGDTLRLEKIFINLLSNALKFSFKNGLILFGMYEINVHSSKSRVDIVWYVKDTGIGIPEKDRRKLFKRFSQVDDSTDRNYEGIGIGLSLSKALVGLMDGKIWVDSEKGKGSTFYFSTTLDLAVRDNLSDDKHPYDLADISILVIDNIAESRIILKELLSSLGARIETASSISEAYGLLEKKTNQMFDLVIIDRHLPDSTGIETLSKFQEGSLETSTKKPSFLIMLPIGKKDSASYQNFTESHQIVYKPINPKSLIQASFMAMKMDIRPAVSHLQTPNENSFDILRPHLEKLISALQASDPVAIETFFELVKPYTDPATQEVLEKHIQNYAYHEAAEIVRRLLNG